MRANLAANFALRIEEELVVVSVGRDDNDRVVVGAKCADAVDRGPRGNRKFREAPVTREVFWQNLCDVLLTRLLLEIEDVNGAVIGSDAHGRR